MALISEQDQGTLRAIFTERLLNDVTITYFTQRESLSLVPSPECAYCADTRNLLEEVCDLSDKLHLEVKDFVADMPEAERLGIARIPAFVLTGKARGQVRYFGIPAGYEFSSLVEDLIDVAAGTTDLSAATRETLAALQTDLHIQVFVTPTCPYCPRAARLAHKLAVESAHVTADVVEVSEFPELSQRYNIYGVPKTVVNEDLAAMEGAIPESRFMRDVMSALEAAKQAPATLPN
jgi:glutaredoxin-like protein